MLNKKNEQLSFKYMKFFLYLLMIVLINLAGIKLFVRADLTKNSLYSLSTASIQAVESLNEPLTIHVFFSSNLPAPYNNIERYLRDLLAEYAQHVKDRLNFNYSFHNVTASETDVTDQVDENRKQAEDYGIYPVQVNVIEKDQVKAMRAYMGMVMVHGDVMEKLPAINSTEGLEYKITSTMQKMSNKISALLNLDGKIMVTLANSGSLNQIAPLIQLKNLDTLPALMKNVVDRVNAKSYGRLQLSIVDPGLDTTAAERFAGYMLRWNEMFDPSGNKIAAGQGTIALGLSYQDKKLEIPLLQKSMALTNQGLVEQFSLVEEKAIDEFITSNIDRIISVNQDIAYLSSHGTALLGSSLPPQLQMMQQNIPSLKTFGELIGENYEIKNVDLKNAEIPTGVNTLIIAGPTEEFSDWELYQIDQFLMNGGSLALFVDTFQEVQQQNNPYGGGYNQPNYLPINTGLDKLLNHYGLAVKRSYILDEECYEEPGDMNRAAMKVYFAPMIKNEQINQSVEVLQTLKMMIGFKMSPLEFNQERLEKLNLKLTKLIRSSPRAWEMSGRINLMPMFIQAPTENDKFSQFDLACLLEGSFPSYFADKAIPEKPKKEEKTPDERKDVKKEEAPLAPAPVPSNVSSEQGRIKQGKPAKVFIMPSASMVQDMVLASPDLANRDFIVNMIDKLNGREGMAIMRSKNQRFNPLHEVGPKGKFFVKAINIVGLPLLAIVMGLLVYFRRQRRKSWIQTEFSQK